MQWARLPVTLRETPALVPSGIATVLITALGASEGGYRPATWYPAALFLLGLLTVSLVALSREQPPPRAVVAAVALLWAFAAWSFLSIAWADDQGAAVDGANRTLLYAIVFSLFSLWPQSDRSASVLVGAFGLGVAAIGLVELLRLDAASDPKGYFLDERLAEPVGYHNGNVAFWFLGFGPCAWLAARRESPAVVRALALGGAGVLVGLALMGQSRGWFFSLPVVLLLFVVLTPGRGRLIAALLAAGIAGYAMSGPVLEVHDSFTTGPGLAELVDEAARAILTAAGALLALGLVAGVVDRRVEAPARVARATSAGVVALALLALAGGVAVWVSKEGSPVRSVSDAWREFKRGDLPRPGETRFTSSLGSARYDIWRVALDRFEAHPTRGLGADNFQQDYLARGRTTEQPRYPHSFELMVVSQTGIVGALLALGALIAALVAAGAARLRGGAGARAAASGALIVFLYWLVHGSVDWFWELPALGASALAMLGIAAALAPRPSVPLLRGLTRFRRAAIPAVALSLVASALALTLPWLAERHVQRAIDDWRERPAEALDGLRKADGLNPLSTRARLVAGTIAVELGRLDLARREFRAALRRDPRNSYATLELGAIASERGDRPAALRLLRRSRRLTPRDGITMDALARVRSGRRLSVARLNASIRAAARALLSPR